MEQLYVFGTGNAAVTRCYNTCFAIRHNNDYFLADAGGGNGILTALEQMNVPLTSIHHMFITHEHNDHILGAIWSIRMIATRIISGQYNGTLSVYCHDGLVETIKILCRLTIQKKFYDIIGNGIFIIPVQDGETRQLEHYRITFFDIHSTKARQFGFTMTLVNGKKLTFTGDEPYHPLCASFIQHSDWLLHEAFCLYEERDRFKPYEKHHSTVKDACELAESLNISNLVLWHTEDKDMLHRKERYLKEGRTFYQGNLFVPDDREIITL